MKKRLIRGLILLLGQRGEYPKAIANFTMVLEHFARGFSRMYFFRALAFYRAGDFDRAIADNTFVIQESTKDSGVGGFRMDLDSGRVIEYPSSPGLGDPVAYTNRGLAYASKGDFDRAIADYTQAIRVAKKGDTSRAEKDAAQPATSGTSRWSRSLRKDGTPGRKNSPFPIAAADVRKYKDRDRLRMAWADRYSWY